MDLLTNAIESIRVGVEDYQTGAHPRLLSAVRNIHAGILLLYKEALRRLSPHGSDDVLMKSKILPRKAKNGKLEFVGVSNKTVDVQQIKERFESLMITTDWNRFEKISKVRNDIEHHYTTVNQKTLQSVVADAFVIVRNFVIKELKGDPLEMLGNETWKVMLVVSEIYEAERKECSEALKTIDWQLDALSGFVNKLSCEQCGSNLLAPTDTGRDYDEVTLRCRACGTEEQAVGFVPRAVKTGLVFEMYLVGDDGATLPYVHCPECSSESYIIEEQTCAFCGYQAEHDCAVCGNPIPPEELDLEPYCGWCAHMRSKDD